MKVHARRGNFLFIPQGPILASGEKILNFKFLIFKQLVEKFKEIAKEEKVGFIRISPILNDTEENKEIFKDLGFKPAPIHMHAEITWTLKLTPSEEKLLMGMRKTTRNLIRRAAKEGVVIETGTSDRDIEIFNNLYQETVKKHNFTPFDLTYLKKQVIILSKDDAVHVIRLKSSKTFLEKRYTLPRVIFGRVFFYYSPKIVKIMASALSIADSFPLEKIRRGNFWVFILRACSMMVKRAIPIKNYNCRSDRYIVVPRRKYLHSIVFG